MSAGLLHSLLGSLHRLSVHPVDLEGLYPARCPHPAVIFQQITQGVRRVSLSSSCGINLPGLPFWERALIHSLSSAPASSSQPLSCMGQSCCPWRRPHDLGSSPLTFRVIPCVWLFSSAACRRASCSSCVWPQHIIDTAHHTLKPFCDLRHHSPLKELRSWCYDEW